jgi:hypothetical protein
VIGRGGYATLIVVIALVIAGCASSGPRAFAGSTASSGASTPAAGDPPTVQRLWAIANSAAVANGGTVFAADAVESTHSKAVRVTMGDGVSGDELVWVVQVEGERRFVCNGCSRPPGATSPTGRYLLLVLDARTFDRTDFGIGPTVADLTKLGPVVTLHA